MLRRFWQGRQQLDPGTQVADGFQIRRAVARVLARPLPVGNGLLETARRGVVLGGEFRLGLADLGEARLQHVGNALMVLLAGTAEQRLIGRLLDEGMLEEVGRLRRPPLVQQLRLH